MQRRCPSCASEAVPISGLIVSDAQCTACGAQVGIRWAFRALFFVIILVVTAVLGIAVLIEQGLYAALLIISLPIGAIGYIKARFCPLVARNPQSSV